jgi:hypothetical protein
MWLSELRALNLSDDRPDKCVSERSKLSQNGHRQFQLQHYGALFSYVESYLYGFSDGISVLGSVAKGAQVLISRLTGQVTLGRFYLSGYGVNQELRITSGLPVNREQARSLPTSGLPVTYCHCHVRPGVYSLRQESDCD